MKSIIGFLNNCNLNAMISISLIIIYMSLKNVFRKNFLQYRSAVLISCNQKTVQIRDSRARVRVTHGILKNNCHNKTSVGTTVLSHVLTAKGAKISKCKFSVMFDATLYQYLNSENILSRTPAINIKLLLFCSELFY